MKTCARLMGVVAFIATANSLAVAGEYHKVTSTYRTVTASSNVQVSAPPAPPGDLRAPVRAEDHDPADGEYRTATSDAEFQWIPAFVGDNPPAVTLKHSCNYAVNFSFNSDEDSYSRAGASFSNFPSDYQASFSGGQQYGSSVSPTTAETERYNIGVPGQTFTVMLGVGAKADTLIGGFSASASSTAAIQTTSIEVVPAN